MPGDINSYALSLELNFTENAVPQLERISNIVGSIERSLLDVSNQFSNFAFKTIDGGKAFNKLSASVSGFNKQFSSVRSSFGDIARSLSSIQKINLSAPIDKLHSKTVQYDKLLRNMMTSEKSHLGSEEKAYTKKHKSLQKNNEISAESPETTNSISKGFTPKISFDKVGVEARGATKHVDDFSGKLKVATHAAKSLEDQLVVNPLVGALMKTALTAVAAATGVHSFGDAAGLALATVKQLEAGLHDAMGAKDISNMLNVKADGQIEQFTKVIAPISKITNDIAESFHTLNFRAVGSIREMSLQVAKLGQIWPFTLDEIQKSMIALRETGMDVSHITGKDSLLYSTLAFERMTGASAAGVAEFSQSMIALGGSSDDVKAKLGQLIKVQKEYGLTGEDLNTVLHAQQVAALKFGKVGSKSVSDYENSLIRAVAAAKQLGVSGQQALQIKDERESSMVQQIMMSGGKWRLGQSSTERQTNQRDFMRTDEYKQRKEGFLMSKDAQTLNEFSEIRGLFKTDLENRIAVGDIKDIDPSTNLQRKDTKGELMWKTAMPEVPTTDKDVAAAAREFDKGSVKGASIFTDTTDLDSSRGDARAIAETNSTVMANWIQAVNPATVAIGEFYRALVKDSQVMQAYSDLLLIRAAPVSGTIGAITQISGVGAPQTTVPSISGTQPPNQPPLKGSKGVEGELGIEGTPGSNLESVQVLSRDYLREIEAKNAETLKIFTKTQFGEKIENINKLSASFKGSGEYETSDLTKVFKNEQKASTDNALIGQPEDYKYSDEQKPTVNQFKKQNNFIPTSDKQFQEIHKKNLESMEQDKLMKNRLDRLKSTGQPIAWNKSNTDLLKWSLKNPEIKNEPKHRTEEELNASLKHMRLAGINPGSKDKELRDFAALYPDSHTFQKRKNDDDSFEAIQTLQNANIPIRDRNLQHFMRTPAYKEHLDNIQKPVQHEVNVPVNKSSIAVKPVQGGTVQQRQPVKIEEKDKKGDKPLSMTDMINKLEDATQGDGILEGIKKLCKITESNKSFSRGRALDWA